MHDRNRYVILMTGSWCGWVGLWGLHLIMDYNDDGTMNEVGKPKIRIGLPIAPFVRWPHSPEILSDERSYSLENTQSFAQG